MHHWPIARRWILSAILFAWPSHAAFAQAPTGLVPTTPDSFGWTGFHAAVSADWSSTNAQTSFDPRPSAAAFGSLMPTILHPDPSGPSYRLAAGVTEQLKKVAIGGEGDFSWFNPDGSADVTPILLNDGTPFPGGGSLHASMYTDWIATARARVGMAFGRVLVFGAGGLAFGSVTYQAETDYRPMSTADFVADRTATRVGWTFGGGVEIRINKRLGAKGEYRYLNLGPESMTVDSTPSFPPFQVAYTWQTRIANYSGGIVIHF